MYARTHDIRRHTDAYIDVNECTQTHEKNTRPLVLLVRVKRACSYIVRRKSVKQIDFFSVRDTYMCVHAYMYEKHVYIYIIYKMNTKIHIIWLTSMIVIDFISLPVLRVFSSHSLYVRSLA